MILPEPWMQYASSALSYERAMEFNWLAWIHIWADLAGCASDRDHVRVVTGVPVGFLNSVVWHSSPFVEVERRVGELTDAMAEEAGGLSVPMEWGTVGSDRCCNRMDRALEAAGWKLSWESPGMRCDLTTSEPTYAPRKEFLIVPVRTTEHVQEWLNPFMDGFQVCSESRSYLQRAWEKVAQRSGHPMRNYLLLHDGKGITAGSIQFKYGVAVIYNISTVKEGRGRGGATEMVKFLKAVARQEGYDSVSLFALKAGQPIYERLGFRENSARNRVVCLDSLSRQDCEL